MDVRQLKYFLAVDECGGFHAASEKLNITQPAVSTAIAKLEESLGVRLFDRAGRQPRLTREGAAYRQHARSILAQIDAARQDIAALAQLQKGLVRLGAPVMIASHILPQPIIAFRTRYPGVRIQLMQMGGMEVEERLADGAIDLGFTGAERISPKLMNAPVVTSAARACMSRSNPLAHKKSVSWADIAGQPLAMFDRSYSLRRYLDELAEQKCMDLDVVFESNIPALLSAACANSNLVSILLDGMKVDADELVMKPIRGGAAMTVSVLWAKHASLSVAGAAMLAFLRE